MSDSLLQPHRPRQAPLSMRFLRQEHWGGLPFPSPKDLPNPGIEPVSPIAPALADRFFTTEAPGKPLKAQVDGKYRDCSTNLNIFYLH